MKNIWKLFLLLLCVTVAISVLVACSCNDTPEAPTTTTTSLSTSSTPDTAKTPSTQIDETVATSAKTSSSTTASVTLPKPIESCETHTPSAGGTYCSVCYSVLKTNEKEYLNMIYFACDDQTLTEAYQIALADYKSNVKKYKDGVLKRVMKCPMVSSKIFGFPFISPL